MANNKHISIGRLGEQIAEGYLKNRDFIILDRNYRQKCGEIDIVAQKDGVLHFVEVKAGSWEGAWPVDGADIHRPEDHMHSQKCARLSRVIQTYLIDKHVPKEKEYTVDLVMVLIDEVTRKARVRVLWNVLLT